MLSKRQIASGVIIWLLVFGAFVTLAGAGEFVETLSEIAPTETATIFVALATGLVAMGSVLYVITRSLDLGFSFVEAVFLNTTVNLAHNLTPFGQAGGEPIGAAILSRRTSSHYEECLAALSAKDVISFVPAILMFVVGGIYIALFEQSVPGELRPLFAAFALVVLVVIGAVVAIHRRPAATRRVLQRVVGAVNRTLARLPLVPSFEEAEIERRLRTFSDSIGAIASDRPTIVLASALATVAFTAQGVLLWLALAAVGINVPVALAIFIVPVSLLASGLPLPGGSGGVESVQVLMLLATTGADESLTIIAVVLSRGLVYWTPIVLGSLTLIGLQITTFRA